MVGRGPRDRQINSETGAAVAPRLPAHATFLPRRQPLLYLTSALASGILLDILPGIPLVSQRLAAVASVTCVALSALLIAGRRESAATASLLIGFAAAGCLLSQLDRSRPDESRLKNLFEAGAITRDDPVILSGRLALPPEPAPGARYLYVDAQSIQTRNGSRAATGRARLIVALADEESAAKFDSLALDYGSGIRAAVRLERARHYGNPGSIDFNDFLERDGCDLKGSINSPLLISRAPSSEDGASGNSALAWVYRARGKLVEAVDARFNRFTGGTLKAMLVDNRFFLDDDAAERLREGGTFHIISISGMHVGLLAWMLLGGFFSPGRKRMRGRGRAWKAGLVLLALWVYAVMAGLAPPVTRATLMVSIALTGPLLFRRAASINTLALAAFVMLAHTPSLIADPGFQLSFVAVAAIVAIAVPIGARLEEIGEWQPSARAPRPPSCSRPVRALAEALFWNERRFMKEQKDSPIRYRMDKSRAALVLGRLRVQPLVRGAAMLLLTSAAIQVATLPLTALYFNRVTPVGVLLNVATGLLTCVLILGSLCAMAVGSIFESLAAPIVWLVDLAHHLLVYSVEPFADLPLATFRVAHYEGWRESIYGLYFIPLCLLVAAVDRWRPVGRSRSALTERPARRSFYISLARAALAPCVFLPALLICSIVVARPYPASPDGRLRIHFLDVGQGDSALIIFPRGSTMLVDAGGEMSFSPGRPDSERESDLRRGFPIGEVVVSRLLWSLGYTRVDYLLATHGDADHARGLSDVARNFDVGQAILGRLADEGPEKGAELLRLRKTLAARGVPLGQVSAGQRFEIEGVRIEIVWPKAHASGSSSNNDSLVIRLVYGEVSILMTGDIERGTENILARSGVDLRADVLKVPHHGSKTSSSEDFLERVAPECAVISVGERSRFGHPHQDVLDRYRRMGARVYQTGRDGMVTVCTDGHSFAVDTYKNGAQKSARN